MPEIPSKVALDENTKRGESFGIYQDLYNFVFTKDIKLYFAPPGILCLWQFYPCQSTPFSSLLIVPCQKNRNVNELE